MAGKIFATSDLHFNHDKMFVWSKRGFSGVDEMNREIIKRWNQTVAPDDVVWVLGDLMLGGAQKMNEGLELIKCLNGELHIVLGNHDTDERAKAYKTCYNVVEVVNAARFKYNGYHFDLSHYPTFTGSLEKDSLRQTLVGLYGHTHQTDNFYKDIPFMYHVGVDSHNCYPVALDDIIVECENKVQECKEKL